jgi:hypothetical protein
MNGSIYDSGYKKNTDCVIHNEKVKMALSDMKFLPAKNRENWVRPLSTPVIPKRWAGMAVMAALMLLATVGTVRADAASASATATATVTAPIALAANTPLGFGTVIPNGTAGTVTLDSTGVRVANGGVTLGSAAGVSPLSFIVTGTPNATFSVTPPTSITLSDGASHTMIVDGFYTLVAPWMGTGTGTILGTGTLTGPPIGADLHVGTAATQPAGNYTGTVSYSVAYN